MAILLSHNSALDYWRSCVNVTDPMLHKALLGSSDDRKNATLSARKKINQDPNEQLSKYLSTHPAHFITTQHERHIRRNGCVHHRYHYIPSGSCVLVSKHPDKFKVFVSSPEFCFLQMASVLPLSQLIALGYELCGTYTIRDGNTTYGCLPLTTPAKLRTFLNRCDGLHGIKIAKRAARYIRAGSASPMESILTMFLCLPYSLGGYGLPFPELNHKIEIPLSLRKKLPGSYYVCDLYWKNSHLAIEYDSDLFHAGINQTVRDAMRKSVLAGLDLYVINLTRPLVTETRTFNEVAHVVARKLGKQLRYTNPGFTYKHLELRDKILYSQLS